MYWITYNKMSDQSSDQRCHWVTFNKTGMAEILTYRCVMMTYKELKISTGDKSTHGTVSINHHNSPE